MALLVALAGCSDAAPSLPGDARTFIGLDDFLSAYWQRPIPLQGAAPEGFSPLEASLKPSTCGTCHAQQYADWQTTIHAGAYTPGLSGQLVNMSGYAEVQACLVCHAPLSEQSAMVGDDETGALVMNPFFDKELQTHGLVCAGCHVRGWRRYGPPRRDGSLAGSAAGSPHGGVHRTFFFEDSRFCSTCHQFEFPAPNGKSLQNTYTEWKNSRYAEAGVICQGCHMPDRRHLWRGIHDSTMVAGGVTIEWVDRSAEGVTLRITNSGTGHRFPTYVTPEVRVRIDLLDGDGQVLEGATARAEIRRRVQAVSGDWIELSDTRLAPDSSLAVVALAGDSGARYARGSVTVYPDAFYQGVFEGMLVQALSDTSRTLIAEAHRRTLSSSFKIFDETVPLR